MSFLAPSSGYLYPIHATGFETVKATIKSEHIFTSSSAGWINDKEAWVNTADGLTFTPASGILVMEFENKYGLSSLPRVILDDVDKLYYCPLTSLSGSPNEGDVDCSVFAPMTKLETLAVSSSANPNYSVVGNIASLGSLVNLTYLVMDTSYLDGSIEGFVAAQRRHGRTSATSINMGYYAGHVTFQGQQVTGSSDKVLSWTPTSITFDGVTINA